jgi:hypothetical protein
LFASGRLFFSIDVRERQREEKIEKRNVIAYKQKACKTDKVKQMKTLSLSLLLLVGQAAFADTNSAQVALDNLGLPGSKTQSAPVFDVQSYLNLKPGLLRGYYPVSSNYIANCQDTSLLYGWINAYTPYTACEASITVAITDALGSYYNLTYNQPINSSIFSTLKSDQINYNAAYSGMGMFGAVNIGSNNLVNEVNLANFWSIYGFASNNGIAPQVFTSSPSANLEISIAAFNSKKIYNNSNCTYCGFGSYGAVWNSSSQFSGMNMSYGNPNSAYIKSLSRNNLNLIFSGDFGATSVFPSANSLVLEYSYPPLVFSSIGAYPTIGTYPTYSKNGAALPVNMVSAIQGNGIPIKKPNRICLDC